MLMLQASGFPLPKCSKRCKKTMLRDNGRGGFQAEPAFLFAGLEIIVQTLQFNLAHEPAQIWYDSHIRQLARCA